MALAIGAAPSAHPVCFASPPKSGAFGLVLPARENPIVQRKIRLTLQTRSAFLTKKDKKSKLPPMPDFPKSLQTYETMVVLRPDIVEEERLALTQRYEEAIIAGGGMDIEMFNRGIMPLAYTIKRRTMSGEQKKYLDGIYYLFTYATKPESQLALQEKLKADDDVIRCSTFKLNK